ncbi:hypothetical protein [Desulfonema ishimotonii]|uniref:hypothetical protein n=1 Tax=Desulfonema ishimotonii TaxID=45657 RepID=UPI000F58679D|nr:hypothetical protein [Desulfonema ishimotonii]
MIKEISCVPDENLEAIYELIHYFRMGLEAHTGNTGKPPIKLTQMPGDAFDSFIEKVARQRQKAPE